MRKAENSDLASTSLTQNKCNTDDDYNNNNNNNNNNAGTRNRGTITNKEYLQEYIP
jgi:hypothetical protein